MKVLVVIDMQKDFVSPEGVLYCESLYTKSMEDIIPVIKERIYEARQNKEMVIFTQDTHTEEDYPDSIEAKSYPPHCLYGTEGWQIVDELADEATLCVYKKSYGCFDLINRIQMMANALNERPEIEICGGPAGVCVAANAALLRTAFPNSIIRVNRGLIADVNRIVKADAMGQMKRWNIEVI